MDARDIEIIEKLCPEQWQRYCECEWGTAEDMRSIEEGRRLDEGWVRDEDGVLYFPFP